jgi:hypothetical protein
MTFVANSGVKFPNLTQQTREAGSRALEGASDLWRLLAGIEGTTGAPPADATSHRQAAVANLEKSLSIYQSIPFTRV